MTLGDPHMSLTLYMHPFASFCQKVLIALYENDTPFTPRSIDLGNPAERALLTELWPIGRFPVLRDDKLEKTIPESTIIIEHLARHYPGKIALVPHDADRAAETRAKDRFFDIYIDEPMQKIVTDRIRPSGKNDPHGVEHARSLLQTAYGILDGEMKSRTWAIGDEFTMADCAAAPGLFYANLVLPFGQHTNVTAYYERLMARPSFRRVVAEAEPFFKFFPR
jgi:glutathione S-transferase